MHFLPTLSTFSIDKPMTFIVGDTKRESVGVSAHAFIRSFILSCTFRTILLKTLLIPTSSRFSSRVEVPLLFKVEKGRERKRKKKEKAACAEDIVNKVRGPANKKIAFLKEVERTGGAPRTSVRTV